MFTSVGLHDPCPCGGLKTFKNCCLPALERPDFDPNHELDQLEALAFAVMPAVLAHRLERAELLCFEIKHRWPHLIEWRGCYAILYEGRGDMKRAAKHWRLAADFARTHPGFEGLDIERFAARAEQLDPSPDGGAP